jgi:hypothetical protein
VKLPPMEMLDMNDPDFEAKFVAALGIQPGEKVQFITPQFTRVNGIVVSYFPKTIEEYEFLKVLTPENLKKLGCQKWDGDDEKIHWLYPSEWYPHMPAGLEIVSISGETEHFVPGETDNDIRFGALAYGFIQYRESSHTMNESTK